MSSRIFILPSRNRDTGPLRFNIDRANKDAVPASMEVGEQIWYGLLIDRDAYRPNCLSDTLRGGCMAAKAQKIFPSGVTGEDVVAADLPANLLATAKRCAFSI